MQKCTGAEVDQEYTFYNLKKLSSYLYLQCVYTFFVIILKLRSALKKTELSRNQQLCSVKIGK